LADCAAQISAIGQQHQRSRQAQLLHTDPRNRDIDKCAIRELERVVNIWLARKRVSRGSVIHMSADPTKSKRTQVQIEHIPLGSVLPVSRACSSSCSTKTRRTTATTRAATNAMRESVCMCVCMYYKYFSMYIKHGDTYELQAVA
jgi:hypothetical protein